ncbi:plasmid recombination protein [Halomonas sp. DP5N14-9]|uniref:plasmid recombination protein n=1 Tax=Halomonas sp. DP5N14-9 TaxID=2859075 RepID=UPI001C99C9D8|nr:plasmid recombination protein [Halomonas sp. DP5N14-9]MBY5943050.1 plasmid recombination protein [Halomonas sp. DP5N14-9]
MANSVDLLNARGGKIVERKIRSDAPALGTVIASLPSETKDTPREIISRFRQECIDWFKGYLENAGMHLKLLHPPPGRKITHLHLWFTPGRETLSRREWKMGKVTNPSLPEKENMRRSFFREIGNRYFDELEKPK